MKNFLVLFKASLQAMQRSIHSEKLLEVAVCLGNRGLAMTAQNLFCNGAIFRMRTRSRARRVTDIRHAKEHGAMCGFPLMHLIWGLMQLLVESSRAEVGESPVD